MLFLKASCTWKASDDELKISCTPLELVRADCWGAAPADFGLTGIGLEHSIRRRASGLRHAGELFINDLACKLALV